MPFSFSFFLFPCFCLFPRFSSLFCRSPCSLSWFLFRSFCPFVLSLFLFRSFCPFVLSFSVCFLYRLLRFSFRFPAFLGGGSCYSVISSRRYTPPRAPCEPGVCAFPLRAVFFLAFLMLTFFFFFSSFPVTFLCLRCTICFSYCVCHLLFYFIFSPEVIFRSRVIGACPVATDCIVAMS